jgi:hypothetical protein
LRQPKMAIVKADQLTTRGDNFKGMDDCLVHASKSSQRDA